MRLPCFVVSFVCALGLSVIPLANASAAPAEPPVELLWPAGAPGAVGSEDVDRPSLTFYLPGANKATGTAVVVCPGGGYHGLAMDHEGKQIAQWLNSIGIAAFVLKYRLGPRYHYPAPLLDAQRALRKVRSRANEFHVSPKDIGIWGFSAGGHLASTAATHFDGGTRARLTPPTASVRARILPSWPTR
jgi:acetyl esterase/lipase